MRRAMNPIYEAMPVSVFARMSELAARHGAVNLGQGFPDFGWPPEVIEAAADALRSLRLEATAASTRTDAGQPVADEQWWADQWTTAELPAAA